MARAIGWAGWLAVCFGQAWPRAGQPWGQNADAFLCLLGVGLLWQGLLLARRAAAAKKEDWWP